MAEKEYEVDGTGSAREGNPKYKDERVKGRKDKKKKHLLKETEKFEVEQEVDGGSPLGEGNLESNDEMASKRKKKRNKQLLKAFSQNEELSGVENGERQMLTQAAKGKEEEGANERSLLKEGNLESNDKAEDSRKKKRKELLLKEAAEADRRGICYLSRVPPHMDHVKLRHILSRYGDIRRIYLVPEDPAARVHRKKAGGFRGQEFSEGWVEFTDKRVAKGVANMLNGEQIGGKKRSQFYYDIWNIKYLRKFKWDDITEEIALKNAVRQQKLELEISAAKKERDWYISNVEKSIAKSHIEERLKKKQKIGQDTGTDSVLPVRQQAGKAIRHLPQKKPVADKAEKGKAGLSKEFLAGIFGGSS